MVAKKVKAKPALKEVQSLLSSAKTEIPDMVIRFISLQDRRQIVGIEAITEALTQEKFRLDHFEYKVTTKTEIRRPINPKFKNGPTEKVTLEERVNINSQLKTVGQLNWRVQKEPENVLVVQLIRAKGESFCLPLIFQNIFNQYRQILVTGVSKQVRLQLLVQPDLQFEKIPELVSKNAPLREQLKQRASRSKGMQSTARELLDLPCFPEEIIKKITAVATGQRVKLSEALAVNLIIISDVHSRYAAVLQTFQEDVVAKKSSVAALARQFAELTQGISAHYIADQLEVFFEPEETISHQSNAQIFSFIFAMLQKMDEKKIVVNDRPITRTALFGLLRGIIISARSQKDPELWQKCQFFLNPEDAETKSAENQETLVLLAEKTKKLLIASHEAKSKSLLEVYFVYNIQNYVLGKLLKVSKRVLSEEDLGIAKSVVVPQLRLRLPKGPSKKPIFTVYGAPHPSHELINPMHFMGRCYGFLISRILMENMQKFMVPGLKILTARFGKNFFDILYGKVVADSGLPLSRNQLAQWIQQKKLIAKLGDKGFLPNHVEDGFDPLLSIKVLLGTGDSIFALNYSQEDFNQDYQKQRQKFFKFIEKLKNYHKSTKDTDAEEFNPAAIFLDMVEKGRYNFFSSGFRNRAKKSFLLEELNEVVLNSCADIRHNLEQEAVNRKIILKIPYRFSPIVYIAQTFDISTGNQVIQVFLLPIPVKTVEELTGISKKFSINFALHLQQGDHPERRGLVQTVNILREYQKVSMEFFRFSSILFLDRLIHERLVQKNKQEGKTPEHIRNFFSDQKKLMIGSIKDLNLSKLLCRDIALKGPNAREVDSQTFGQMLQSILYYRSASKHFALLRTTLKKVLALLDRFAKQVKAEEEWKKYQQMAAKFDQLISIPIEELNAKRLKWLETLSIELQKMSAKAGQNGPIGLLHSEWKKRNPSHEKGVLFYSAFIPSDTAQIDNLLLELKAAQKLSLTLKSKDCLIFFPEASKQSQLRHIAEIGKFINKQSIKVQVYVEIENLEKDRVEEFARIFDPSYFFSLSKLKPLDV